MTIRSNLASSTYADVTNGRTSTIWAITETADPSGSFSIAVGSITTNVGFKKRLITITHDSGATHDIESSLLFIGV